MLLLTHLDATSTYVADVLPPLMIMGFAMGTIMPASMQTATLGVDRSFAGVASATVEHQPAGRRLDRARPCSTRWPPPRRPTTSRRTFR